MNRNGNDLNEPEQTHFKKLIVLFVFPAVFLCLVFMISFPLVLLLSFVPSDGDSGRRLHDICLSAVDWGSKILAFVGAFLVCGKIWPKRKHETPPDSRQ